MSSSVWLKCVCWCVESDFKLHLINLSSLSPPVDLSLISFMQKSCKCDVFIKFLIVTRLSMLNWVWWLIYFRRKRSLIPLRMPGIHFSGFKSRAIFFNLQLCNFADLNPDEINHNFSGFLLNQTHRKFCAMHETFFFEKCRRILSKQENIFHPFSADIEKRKIRKLTKLLHIIFPSFFLPPVSITPFFSYLFLSRSHTQYLSAISSLLVLVACSP